MVHCTVNQKSGSFNASFSCVMRHHTQTWAEANMALQQQSLRNLKPSNTEVHDGQDQVHAGQGTNKVKLCPVQRGTETEGYPARPMPLWCMVTVTVPGRSLGRTPGVYVHSLNFKCELGSCQRHVISSHLEIWLSLSQEALGSTTVSTRSSSEGLELLRQHELAAAVHVVHHLLLQLRHLLPEHVGRGGQLRVLGLECLHFVFQP